MKKRLCLLLALLVLLLSTAACSSGDAGTTPPANDGVANASANGAEQTYILCTYNSTEYYQRVIWSGFQAAGEMLGVKTELYGDTGEDIIKYLTLLDNAAAANPQGIAVMCLDADAYVDGINSAVDKGIPVFTVAPDSPHSDRTCFLGLENISVGRFAGEVLGEKIGGEGEILVLIRAGMQTCQDRLSGFESYLAENYPNVTTKVIQVSLDLADQTSKTSAALAANPNIAAVYCPLGWQAVAVSKACDELNYKDIPILGMDVELAQLELVKEGKIMGTLRQGNYDQGFWACLGMYLINNDYISEDTFPSSINPGYYVVDQSNVDAEIEFYYEYNPEARK